MKSNHLSDQDIQRFTFDLSGCETEIRKHIQSCEICKMRVDSYRSLSNSIKEQPEPVLEFDLTELVMDQLKEPKKVTSYNYIINLLLLVSTGLVVWVLMLFKETLIDLFRTNAEIPSYFMISVAVLISIVLGMDMLRSFNKKINMLNY